MAQTSNAMTRRAAIVSGAALIAGCGRAENRPFFLSDGQPADFPTVLAVEYMAQLLRERTGGRMDIKVYSGGQLGAERDTLEITTFGGLDMVRVNSAPLTSIEPMTAITSLPFLFRSQQHMRAALDGEPGEAILASLRRHNLIGLCYYDSGARSFYNTQHPIHTPADMRGLKIRVQNSDIYVAMVRALGADATPMPYDEVYQALVQGVVDGAENNWPSYESSRHFEAAQYYSLDEHVMGPEVLVMSLSRWERLSNEDREIVRQAAKDSVPYMRELWDARVAASRERILAAGVEVNEVADREAFASLMRPIWNRFVVTPEQVRVLRAIENMDVA